MKPKNNHLTLRGGVWYCRVRSRGREVWRSLQTAQVDVARARRDHIIEEIRGERWQEVLHLSARPEIATLGTIVAAYAAWCKGAKLRPRTAQANIAALRSLVRAGTQREPDTQPASVLTAALLARYQADAIERARPMGPGRLNSALNSTHSIARQARSVFARKPVQRGAYEGLHLPDLEPFLRYSLDRGKTARPVPATAALLNRTRQVAAALRKRRPAVWIALQLAANLGLRRGEIAASKWSWFTVAQAPDGAAIVRCAIGGSADYESKGNRRVIQLDPELWREILAARGDAGPHLLPGGDNDREETMRDLSRILRATGWTQRKPVHELRKQCGIAVAHAHGVLAAKDFLGHSSLQVTLDSYVVSLRPNSVRVI